MFTETQIILRILVAAGLGLLIGLERERRSHDAGLRTHMILVTGAALAGAMSINLAVLFFPRAPNGDPARLATGVISGIGFLGAGVIFRSGDNIRGLTTAVSLWTMAVVGLAIGAGFFLAGVAATILLLVILTILDYIENRFIPSLEKIHLMIWADYHPQLLDEVKEALDLNHQTVDEFCVERDLEKAQIILDARLRVHEKRTPDDTINLLASIGGVRKVKVEE